MKIVLVLLLLLGPQLAAAKIYLCRDAVSGETTFTDVACEQSLASREEVRVQPTNVDSGQRTAAPAPAGPGSAIGTRVRPGVITTPAVARWTR